MLVLFETAAGYAVFKLLDEKKLQEVDNLYKNFETIEGASKILKLKQFHKFQDTTEALIAATATVEGKVSKKLKKILKKLVVHEAQEELAVADAKLGNAIKEKYNISCVSNTSVVELIRQIRSQASGLISGLPDKELTAMNLGLAHSLSRYKLKFSPDKVDTMIVQAVSLLDDLDKELNNYVMRCREWYGWHFPELGKIVTDNLAFVRTVKEMGFRTNASKTDFSKILPEEVEEKVREAAEISMGTEISDEDILNIRFLSDQVIEMTNYRAELYDYLKNRMMAIAPNLTILVGELVGARLIARAGSLLNLAKQPASTVQILGAEKALFRALKTKHDTPKYGLIYHAQLVGQTNPKLKGKMSRMLATKCSLAIRYDALGEDTNSEMGLEHRAKLEIRLKNLEEGSSRRISGTGKQKHKFEKYESKSEVKQLTPKTEMKFPVKRELPKDEPDDDEPVEKPAKKVKREVETPVASQPEFSGESSGKKKKKRKHQESEASESAAPVEMSEPEEAATSTKKKKKKKSTSDD